MSLSQKMDDLDTLLADLGRPNAPREDNTTTVNLNELDDLMNDLNDNCM
jgi:hypothetical protein